jgi:hypothetical protein
MMKDAAVKQTTWDDNWIGYDDHEAYALKIQKANERCLGGTFIWYATPSLTLYSGHALISAQGYRFRLR